MIVWISMKIAQKLIAADAATTCCAFYRRMRMNFNMQIRHHALSGNMGERRSVEEKENQRKINARTHKIQRCSMQARKQINGKQSEWTSRLAKDVCNVKWKNLNLLAVYQCYFVVVVVFPWFHLVVQFELNCVFWLLVSLLCFCLLRWMSVYIALCTAQEEKSHHMHQCPKSTTTLGRRCHLICVKFVLFCFLKNWILSVQQGESISCTFGMKIENLQKICQRLKRIKDPLLYRNLLWWKCFASKNIKETGNMNRICP